MLKYGASSAKVLGNTSSIGDRMIKHSVLALGAILSITAVSGVAAAGPLGPRPYNDVRHGGGFTNPSMSYAPQRQRQNQQNSGYNGSYNGGYNRGANQSGPVVNDLAIVNAANGRRDVDWVEGTGMIVVKDDIPDDRKGSPHQSFIVRLSNGSTMIAVYNLGMEDQLSTSPNHFCPRIPIRNGDVVTMGGQFLWTDRGAMLHWLHFDPKQNRPDGYVQVNGVDYCRTGERHN
jgi:hypothetical protein